MNKSEHIFIMITEDVISESSELAGSSTISVCRDLISVALDAFKGSYHVQNTYCRTP